MFTHDPKFKLDKLRGTDHHKTVLRFRKAMDELGWEATDDLYSPTGAPGDRGALAASFEVKVPSLPRVKDFAPHVGLAMSGEVVRRGFQVFVGGQDMNSGGFYVHARLTGPHGFAGEKDAVQELLTRWHNKAEAMLRLVPKLRASKVTPAEANALMLGVCRIKSRWYQTTYKALSHIDRAWRDPPAPEMADRTAWNLLMAVSVGIATVRPHGSQMDRRLAARKLLLKKKEVTK